MPKEEIVYIPMQDGVRLSATLYLPDGGGPFPAVMEALPYRKDDVTNNYAPEYRRLRDEGDYAVCRVDVRGTGSSEGIAEDEYPVQEQTDMCEVINWLATQPWSSGAVGMYGTSYSGFNSLQVAMERPPALKAIISIYATDSRYTDDVHLGGGAQRGLDLIDYPDYMTCLNALPPVPSIFGEGWHDEWEKRVNQSPPWVINWLEHQNEDDYWMQGSLKADYSSIQAATLIIAGWADGYKNMAFRTLEQLDAPCHVLVGPWSHMYPDSSVPGPTIDSVTEMIAWWDRWLRDDTSSPAASWPSVRAYMRRPTHPEPTLAIHKGEWWGEPAWPAARAAARKLPLGSGSDDYKIRGDVGFYGWIWCAATPPWGLPMDQREDDALSLRYDWPVSEEDGTGGEIAILGHPKFHVTVRSSVPVTYLSAKLCDVFPDGTSALVSRGILNLTHRDSHVDPKPLTPGESYDITLELDATSWIFEPGHTIRLSVSTSDWPSSWAPPLPGTITIERDESWLELPVLEGGRLGEPPAFTEPKADKATKGDSDDTHDHQTIWKIEHDVLARERTVTVDYGYRESDPGDPLQMSDQSVGTIRVSTDDPGKSRLDASYWITMRWPEVVVKTSSTFSLVADAETYRVDLQLVVEENGEQKWTRKWDRTIPRNLQ